ncbi:MAG: FAD-dependent oxidoreductase [Pseudomonadota bacterium]
MSGLLIIGASYAGVQAALSARDEGYAAPIRIVADETALPYQRPPLSKAFLLGTASEDSLVLRDAKFFRDRAIDLVLGHAATGLDRHARQVTLANGATLPFDKLVIATGSRARRLAVPGADLPGVLTLRTLADAYHLKAELGALSRLVVIGGGFIGLEVAASASKLGKSVAVIETAPRLLGRAVSPAVSQALLDLHRCHGVDIRLNESVAHIERAASGTLVVVCGSGARLEGDRVLVGVGGLPNAELAAAAGLACGNGIMVDEHGRTDDPHIYAAGDCSDHHNAFIGRRIRLESVQHAQDQGKTVGAAIAGRPTPYTSVPRFWSDQYDAKLQIVGLSDGADLHVIRGRPEDGAFSVLAYRAKRLVAVDSVNRPGEQLLARRLIAAGLSPAPTQAADPAFDLKTLLAAEGARP